MKKSILIIASICISSHVVAGGYRVSTQGQQALGMGHTGVAVSESSEAVFFNPAGISFLNSDLDVTGGVTLVDSVAKYQNHEVNVKAETDNPIGTPINFYIAKKHNEMISYGFGIYTPYGNVVEWEKDWAGSHLVNDIKLRAVYFQPTIAFKVNDKFSVGGGPTYVNGAVDFNRNLSTALVDENGDRANVTVEATNVHAWGYNVGLLFKPNEQLGVGVSYRSKVDMEARGEKADFENIPSSMQSTFSDTTFDADLVLPAEFTLGVSYDLGTNTLIALDYNRAFWGEYESLDISFDNNAPDSINPRNYKDSNIYRIGVQQKVKNNLKLRVGAYYDESPIQSGYFAPETPRNDSIGLTAGATYGVTKNLNLDVSLLYLMFDEFEGSYDHIQQTNGSTTSFEGEYKSTVRAIGFGINYTM